MVFLGSCLCLYSFPEAWQGSVNFESGREKKGMKNESKRKENRKKNSGVRK